ncbi:hypothetical protein [Oleispirillum naphthae]|uniref:hypothetical protein n=1 Tax=Oleispirillum naphthae TaxID=2838853 RepID=UPI003082531E
MILRILAAGALAALAACSTPRPFERPSGSDGELGLPEAEVLCVPAFPLLPPEPGQALRAALAEELVKREVLASAAAACPPGAPRILVWEAPRRDGDAAPPRLMLSRPPAAGRPYPPAIVALPPAAGLRPDVAARGAATLADRLGYLPPARPSVRSPLAGLAPLSRSPAPAAPPAPADETAFVAPVMGATGNGNTLMRFAMLGHLRRAGLAASAEGEGGDAPVVQGRVDIGPVRAADDGTQVRRVRIVWSVTDAKGRALGSLVQANDVPALGLDRVWGQAADAVAAAAAGEIAEILRRARADMQKP